MHIATHVYTFLTDITKDFFFLSWPFSDLWILIPCWYNSVSLNFYWSKINWVWSKIEQVASGQQLRDYAINVADKKLKAT